VAQIAGAIHDAAARFAANALESVQVRLDGSLKSLMSVVVVMQKYHTFYERASAANDPDLSKFVQQVMVESTCYVVEVLVNHMGVQPKFTPAGEVLVVADGVEIPVTKIMLDELKTGKANSLLVVTQSDAIRKKNSVPQQVEPANVATEERTLAEVAVQDVRVMLKQDLDYTPQSLPHVDRTLLRLKALGEMAPANKSTLVGASCDKYGSYIGEVLVRHYQGQWSKVKVRDRVSSVVDLGTVYAFPTNIVEAVLEGKNLSMGDQFAGSVVDFLAVALERKKAAPPSGLFSNLDTPGEMLKRMDQFAEEAARIARDSYQIELDYSLFSLEELDSAIARHRAKLAEAKASLPEEEFDKQFAFSLLPLGAYLGEVFRRMHGGSWEDHNPWPVLGQRAMKLDPITAVRAFLCGQSASNFDKSSVSTVHQYYQGLRPVMLDMMEAKLFGSAGSERNLLTQMGPNTEFNKTMLTLAESCMIFSLAEYRVDLDFSEESLKDVDRLLEIFYKSTEDEIKAKPDLERNNLIYWYGAYSGEVIRRAVGGVWADDASATIPPGPNVPHINLDGNRIFVLKKVRKFLANGPGDSVASCSTASKACAPEASSLRSPPAAPAASKD
jgi:hypothetical protein